MTEVVQASLEIRVLAGRVRGASAPLTRGRMVEIGYEFDADIVLRDASAKGVRVALNARAHAADLEVLEGEVELLGHALRAPAQAILPPYVPLLIGDNAVAIGEPDSARWSEAERILVAAARPTDEEDEPDGDLTEVADAQPAWRHVWTRASSVTSRIPNVGLILVIITGLGLLGTTLLTLPAWPHRQPKPAAAQADLAQAGFPSLTVERSQTGRLLISGLVRNEADRIRLQRLVEEDGMDAVVQVQTSDAIAKGVQDVFLANQLDATAEWAGGGVVNVRVAGGHSEDIARVQQIAASDVPGVRRITITRAAGGAEDFTTALGNQGPQKRVTSVVGGESGYVTTADGSRYFAGAVLPTGHRIVQVQADGVLVDKDGVRSQLKF